MKPGRLIVLTFCVLAIGCAQPTATPVSVASERTASPIATVAPLPTPFPTMAEPAPESTFVEVGSVATLSGADTSGHVVVAGLQTLIIRSFTFDGKDTVADVRLIKAGVPEEPIAVVIELEQRLYDQELLVLTIPDGLADSGVDTIAVYAADSDELLALGVFE